MRPIPRIVSAPRRSPRSLLGSPSSIPAAALLALVALTSLAACVSEPVDPVAAARAPIVGGSRELGEPAVVAVKVVGGLSACTGTLISESVVLTAKHCVQLPGADGPTSLSLITVGVGDTLLGSRDYRVRRVATTPGAYDTGPTGFTGELLGVDLAVLTLRPAPDGTLPSAAPIPLWRGDPSALVGQTMTFVGFGMRPDGTSGDKYTTTAPITAIDAGDIYSLQTICSGDSGGPMIYEGAGPRAVIGVASFGLVPRDGPSCPSMRDAHNRLDPFFGLLDAALIEAGQCPMVSEEVCNSLDDDCDGQIDEACVPLGDPCTQDSECAYAQLPERFEPRPDPVVCAETSAGRICTRPCDPSRALESCARYEHPFGLSAEPALGTYCERISGCEGRCVPGEPGPALDGDACERDADCLSLSCQDPGDGARRCLLGCRADAGICLEGEVCAAPSGACGACVAAGLVLSARGLGEGCGVDEDCRSGICLSDASIQYCSDECIVGADCPERFHCRERRCVRGVPAGPAEPCLEDIDCGPSTACLDEGDRAYCAAACAEASPCAEGFFCEGGRCAALGAILGEVCVEDADCAAGRCVEIGGRSRCSRPCGAEGPCGAGLVCLRAADGRGSYCAPPPRSDGGCAIASRRPGSSIPTLLLLGLLFVRLSRRRRRPLDRRSP